jgi:hypothetical protein
MSPRICGFTIGQTKKMCVPTFGENGAIIRFLSVHYISVLSVHKAATASKRKYKADLLYSFRHMADRRIGGCGIAVGSCDSCLNKCLKR